MASSVSEYVAKGHPDSLLRLRVGVALINEKHLEVHNPRAYKLIYMTLYNYIKTGGVNSVFFTMPIQCKTQLQATSEYSWSTFTTNAQNTPAQIELYIARLITVLTHKP